MTTSTMPFYHAILESYYTGNFVLPIINGVDESSLGYIAFCLISGYYGIDIWKKPIGKPQFGIPTFSSG